MSENKEQFRICYIGRPCYQKNIQFLIEVARSVINEIPCTRFYLLGVGYYSPDLEEIQSLINKYSLGSYIELVDWLPQDEIFDYVQKSDIYISTSRYEGLPLSVIEAMSLGAPIIASNVLGNVDCVFDGDNGYLLPFEVKLFVEKIVLLYNDDELRKRMGARSRELFLEHFCIDSQIDKLKQIYEKIANDK